jgi:hypothetical protein
MGCPPIRLKNRCVPEAKALSAGDIVRLPGRDAQLPLGHDLVPDPRLDRPGQRQVQQRPRVAPAQPPDFELRQPGQVIGRNPGPEHQAGRFGPQPTRHEPSACADA